MPTPLEQLEAEVLSLSPADRSRLLESLIASFEQDTQWQSAWAAEADRREARIERGESTWVSGREAVERLRNRLP